MYKAVNKSEEYYQRNRHFQHKNIFWKNINPYTLFKSIYNLHVQYIVLLLFEPFRFTILTLRFWYPISIITNWFIIIRAFRRISRWDSLIQWNYRKQFIFAFSISSCFLCSFCNFFYIEFFKLQEYVLLKNNKKVSMNIMEVKKQVVRIYLYSVLLMGKGINYKRSQILDEKTHMNILILNL